MRVATCILNSFPDCDAWLANSVLEGVEIANHEVNLLESAFK